MYLFFFKFFSQVGYRILSSFLCYTAVGPYHLSILKIAIWSFPDSSVMRNPLGNVGGMGSISGPGRSPLTKQLSSCARTTEPML